MYTPRAFAESDLGELDRLFARDAFVTLITVGHDGLPLVTHLPVIYRRDGEHVVLEGHWARPNPQASHSGPALAIVHGPHAYISPNWYADKQAAARVPTWNYVVAHLRGSLSAFNDEASLADLVDRLSQQHEARVGEDWRFDFQRDEERRQLRGIIGFRLHVDVIEMKFKLSQNHPQANVTGAADALERLGQHEVADLMRERLARRD